MSTEKASPSVVSGGTQDTRQVTLTREEFIHILLQWERDVKCGQVEQFIDSVFNGADGVIEFKPRASVGGRFA